jgi:hypothetical protein
MGRKLGLESVLDCFSLPQLCTNACVCVHSVEEDGDEEEDERSALVSRQLQELKDFVDGTAKTLAFHLEPKVSQHIDLMLEEGYCDLQNMLTTVRSRHHPYAHPCCHAWLVDYCRLWS